jgi:hypothetical protein
LCSPDTQGLLLSRVFAAPNVVMQILQGNMGQLLRHEVSLIGGQVDLPVAVWMPTLDDHFVNRRRLTGRDKANRPDPRSAFPHRVFRRIRRVIPHDSGKVLVFMMKTPDRNEGETTLDVECLLGREVDLAVAGRMSTLDDDLLQGCTLVMRDDWPRIGLD